MKLALESHPDSPGRAVTAIEVAAERLPGNILALSYRLAGALERVRIPAPAAPRRVDGLWRHTCFEAFIGSGGPYRELNFAPSGEWAAYRFLAYRSGMAPAPDVSLTRFDWTGSMLAVEVAGLPEGRWSLGLSAVIEEMDLSLSYWALAHPPGKPDFHDPACFTRELPPPPAP